MAAPRLISEGDLMAVIAVKCACGEVHRLDLCDQLATQLAAAWPKPRRSDCRRFHGRAPKEAAPEAAMIELERQPVRDELALAFC